MKIPILNDTAVTSDCIRSFYGLNRSPRIAPGESAEETGLGFSAFPFLTPASDPVKLCTGRGSFGAFMMKDKPVWAENDAGNTSAKLYYAGRDCGMVLTPGKKELVSMGTKIVIFPDKVFYDTADGSSGSLEAYYTSVENTEVRFTLASLDGADYAYDASPSAPAAPSDGALWCDTSSVPMTLSRYSESSGGWFPVPSTYIKISSPGIGSAFSESDGVTVSGAENPDINGSYVLTGVGDDYIIIPGILSNAVTQTSPLSVSRRVPDVDFAVEYSNRIWACRSGADRNGAIVNEIYASKLGDPSNFECFDGLVSDSYAVGVGTDGPFTGAAVFLGYVMFFKERCVHKIFGTKPENFQVITSNIAGVAPGCGGSTCVIDDVLYYYSPSGVAAYDGSFPQMISEALGDRQMTDVICTSRGKYLYLFGKRDGAGEGYVYDTKRNMWHALGSFDAEAASGGSAGVFLAGGGKIYVIDSSDSGCAASDLCGFQEKSVETRSWSFETGELTDMTEDIYVEKLQITASVPAGGEMRVEVMCDGGEKRPVVTIRPDIRRSYVIPIITGRCRSVRLFVSGIGRCVIYSIGKFTGKVGDLIGA